MDSYQLKTGYKNMDVAAIHQFLSRESYWAKDIPLEIVKTSVENSFCIGMFEGDKQIGFARLITDYATFGYLADVYILDEYRGKGLSKRMVGHLMELDFVKSLRKTMLVTLDAHTLYSRFGYHTAENPERIMEIKRSYLQPTVDNWP